MSRKIEAENGCDVLAVDGDIMKFTSAFPKVIGSKYDDFYHMKKEKRGKCLIFSQKFQMVADENYQRVIDRDTRSLTKIFENLHLAVIKYEDKNLADIQAILLQAREDNHSNKSCFVCCFLTCGNSEKLYANDKSFEFSDITDKFRCDFCTSLAGKPKIFITMLYQGKIPSHNPGIDSRESTDSGSAEKKIVRIPLCSDFLVVISTISRFYSFSNGEKGSLFIQALCSALHTHGRDKDLVSILTLVNNAVVHFFQRSNDKDTVQKYENSYFESSLTKMIKF